MAIKYKFKTTENIDTKSRTIIKEEPVPATTRKTEFTLEQKESELAGLEKSIVDFQARVTEIKADIAEIKTALKIK